MSLLSYEIPYQNILKNTIPVVNNLVHVLIHVFISRNVKEQWHRIYSKNTDNDPSNLKLYCSISLLLEIENTK